MASSLFKFYHAIHRQTGILPLIPASKIKFNPQKHIVFERETRYRKTFDTGVTFEELFLFYPQLLAEQGLVQWLGLMLPAVLGVHWLALPAVPARI